MLDIICNGKGMFSIGNINPLKIKAGINSPTKEINIATCWESTFTEINKPTTDQTAENDKLSDKVTQNGTNDSGLVKEEPKKEENSEGRTGKYHLDYFGIAGNGFLVKA